MANLSGLKITILSPLTENDNTTSVYIITKPFKCSIKTISIMKTKQYEVQIISREGVFSIYIGAVVRAQVYPIAQQMYPNASFGNIREVG